MATASVEAESDNFEHLIHSEFWRTLLRWRLLLKSESLDPSRLPASSPSKRLTVFRYLAHSLAVASHRSHERCTALQNKFTCTSISQAKLSAKGPLDGRLPAPLLPHAKGSRSYCRRSPERVQDSQKSATPRPSNMISSLRLPSAFQPTISLSCEQQCKASAECKCLLGNQPASETTQVACRFASIPSDTQNKNLASFTRQHADMACETHA